jgi:hypothetical protein
MNRMSPASACFAGAMKRHVPILAGLLCVTLLAAGCDRKPSATSAAADLEKGFQIKAPDASQPGAANTSAPAATGGDEIQQAVAQAVTAIKSKDYAEAFMRLRGIQGSPKITFDQYALIENARLAVERDLAAKAAAGDATAMQALERIKKSGH